MHMLRTFAAGTLSVLASLSFLAAQQPAGTPGERVPPEAIHVLGLEPMSVVLERQRKMPKPTTEQPGWHGEDGRWFVPGDSAKTPTHSGLIAIVNEWGDPRMAIGFPQPTDLREVWVAGHGVASARAVRAIGWRAGVAVARTEWRVLGAESQHWALDLHGIDRVEFEAAPTVTKMAFYALDDLRWQPAGQADGARTLDFEDLAFKTVLDGTNYGGLTWLRGNGFRVPVQGTDLVPAPRAPEGVEPEPEPDNGPQFSGGAGTEPRIWDDFIGVSQGDPGATLIPPDTCGAGGPAHVVMIVNANLSAFVKGTGACVLNVSLGAFWNVTGLIGDPRAVFDPHARRFVVLADTFSGGRTLYFAISQTDDPTGAWFKFSVRTDLGTDAGRWPDYPTLGVDARGIYTSAFMVGSPARMTIWAIDKAPLLQPTPTVGTVTAFRSLPFEGAIQPCTTYGDPGIEYLVSRASSTTMRLRHVAPPLTAPTLVEAGLVAIPSNSSPPNAPALGSTTNISTLDTRFMNAVFRNGSVWTTHGVSSNSRAACRWYEVDPALVTLLQSGTIDDPLWYYYYPSIAVDTDGNVGIGFSGSHAAVYCSTFLTGRLAGDPPGQTAPPLLVKAGEASWNRLDSSGRNRFGDYSHGNVDPIDDRGFWTFQEYIAPAANNWRTRITRFGYESINYGIGLAGTNGIPTLRTADRPRIGQTLIVEAGNSGGLTPAPGVLLLGFQKAAIPTFGGTVLLVSVASLSMPVPAPHAAVPVPVPPSPSLVGVPVYFQAGQIDPGAVQQVAMSPGLEIRCGTN